MSIKRMNIGERARYLIGEAIMRRFENSEYDPAATAEIRDILRTVERWLTPDELWAVTEGTGIVFDDQLPPDWPTLLDEQAAAADSGDDSDIPF